jgi:CubicO group peptidase (beta-lactamase class C family)
MNKIKLQSILDASITKNAIFGTVACIHRGEETWLGASGNLSVQQPYFIASTTKLYVTAILLDLQQENKLSLHDPIAPFLPPSIVNGLHVYNGTDYSNTLTIAQLLSNTSGLPDYFEDNKANGKSLLEELTTGKDRSWTFEEAIALAKTMKPKFAPGQKGKAHYSDTNFQLLEKIIETITGTTFEKALEKSILHPLGLKNTYLFNNPDDPLPATVYYKNKPHNIPKAMSSFRDDGGIVSTAEDTMTFIKAFFNGYFFPKEYL